MPDRILSLQRESLTYDETGFFGESVLDYLNDEPKLRPYYGRRPQIPSFKDQMVEKAATYAHRSLLVSALKRQYSDAGLKSDAIDPLSDPNTFTLTTGHQVCLFTGPLYFFYKIITTVKAARELSAKYPEYNFIPVFWMATEDHDFEEANHFSLGENHKIEWESGQGGAVGRMELVGMEEVYESLKSSIGLGYRSGELLELFESAYLKHETVAAATRYLVDRLFGHLGVVCIDGDDPELKSAMVPYFERELEENVSFRAMRRTNEELKEHYRLQVNPRPINLFYIDQEFRERVVRTDEGVFEVLQTSLRFDLDELKKHLREHPERFSPNVALRPLYQEVILPNLLYVGGGGELNYWFQLKSVFQSYEVPMPILLLRNSALLIDRGTAKLMDDLNVSVHHLFLNDRIELEKQLVSTYSTENLSLNDRLMELQALYGKMEAELSKVDKLLEKSVRSGYVRSERIVKNLEKKMLRAERKKHEILTNRLERIYSKLMPNGRLQEREINFTPFYLEFGAEFADLLLENLDPFEGKFTVLSIK
jgi:bacillithiol biosynthesis cysteine-adding enzyme BshC